MKKMLVFIVAAFVLSIALAGCSEKSEVLPETDGQSVSVQTNADVKPAKSTAEDSPSSFLAGNESKAPESSENIADSGSADTVSTPSTSEALPQSQTPPSKAETAAPKQEITPPPATEKPQQETPQQTTPTTEKPTPTNPPTPTFEISEYVGYAKSYGQGIGLSLDSTATACWDDPLSANAGCTYLKRDLKDRLDWYVASGFTGFWVWSEDLGNGAYQIYIGYC